MDFKNINWALVLVIAVIVFAGVAVSFFTHSEQVSFTNDKGETVINNVTRVGRGDAPKPPKA